MTTRESQFIAELRDLLDKYSVDVTQDRAYYAGDEATVRFSLGSDPCAVAFTLDDIAERRGGVKIT